MKIFSLYYRRIVNRVSCLFPARNFVFLFLADVSVMRVLAISLLLLFEFRESAAAAAAVVIDGAVLL